MPKIQKGNPVGDAVPLILYPGLLWVVAFLALFDENTGIINSAISALGAPRWNGIQCGLLVADNDYNYHRKTLAMVPSHFISAHSPGFDQSL